MVGRCTFSMTAAIVKLLPDPVMPSRVWKRSPRSIPAESARDRVGLVARGGQIGDELQCRHQLDANGGV